MSEINAAVNDDIVEDSKPDPDREGTPSSIESTPEVEADARASVEPAQPQKRKGGRKPIYATSEERKQRNRQAQAAFRERRTEYIKQLEATIKQRDEELTSLQQSHRTAADECLMLRYKNSLLERILLEKGINVQAELQMKTGSPVLGPGFMHPAGMAPVQQSPLQLQRTALQRQQVRRSGGQNFLPKLAPGQPAGEMGFPTASPHTHPTPSSHASSPTQLSTRSPMAVHQGGMTPPTSAVNAQPAVQQYQNYTPTSQPQPSAAFFQAYQQAHVHRQPQRPAPPSNYQSSASGISSHSTSSHQSLAQPRPFSGGNNAGGNTGPSAPSMYPSPFQKHFDQLDQEYDAEHSRSMLEPHFDDPHGQHPSEFQQQSGMPMEQSHMAHHTQYEQSGMVPATGHAGDGAQFDDVDPSDPMLDADPFGLSASMHYPTSYSLDQNTGPSR